MPNIYVAGLPQRPGGGKARTVTSESRLPSTGGPGAAAARPAAAHRDGAQSGWLPGAESPRTGLPHPSPSPTLSTVLLIIPSGIHRFSIRLVTIMLLQVQMPRPTAGDRLTH